MPASATIILCMCVRVHMCDSHLHRNLFVPSFITSNGSLPLHHYCSVSIVWGDGVGVGMAVHPYALLVSMSYPAGHYSLRLLLWLVLCYSAVFHTHVARSGVFNRAVVRC